MSNTYINVTVESKVDWVKKINECQKEIERLKQDNEYLNKVNIELSTLNTSLRSDRDNYKYIIKEVREYIKEKYDYLLGDDTFLDHDERIDSKQIKHILEILDKADKDV